MKRFLALGALLLGLTVPASASAATIYAGPFPASYLNPDVSIAPGEEVLFQNLDFSAPHDVTSIDISPTFQPLFRSETVNAPAEVPVVGAETLAEGSYDYICSIHPNMQGTLTVGGGGGGGKDTQPPKIGIKALERKARAAAKDGRLSFDATVSEKATLKLNVTKGKKRVAKGSAKLRRGMTKTAARLTRAGKKLLRKAEGTVRLRVKAKATDAAGNSATKTIRVKLR